MSVNTSAPLAPEVRECMRLVARHLLGSPSTQEVAERESRDRLANNPSYRPEVAEDPSYCPHCDPGLEWLKRDHPDIHRRYCETIEWAKTKDEGYLIPDQELFAALDHIWGDLPEWREIIVEMYLDGN